MYRPAGAYVVAVSASAAVLVAAALIVAVTEQPAWVRGAAVILVAVAVLAIVELRVTAVRLDAAHLEVRALVRTTIVRYAEVETVKLEGGQLHLRMRSGVWRHLPPWLSGRQAQSARAQIAKRLKAGEHSTA